MKATTMKIGDRYEVIGLDAGKEVDGEMVYEMRYLYSFGSKTYKTEENAIKAILKKGFEYIKVKNNQIICGYND